MAKAFNREECGNVLMLAKSKGLEVQLTRDDQRGLSDGKNSSQILDWTPKCEMPSAQNLGPYCGPGSWGQDEPYGLFLHDSSVSRNVVNAIRFYDSFGHAMGKVDVDPKTIRDVGIGQFVDKDGFVKIFPMAFELPCMGSFGNHDIIIYAVQYESRKDGRGRVVKIPNRCRFTTRNALNHEWHKTNMDPFESFSYNQQDPDVKSFEMDSKVEIAKSTPDELKTENGEEDEDHSEEEDEKCICEKAYLEAIDAQARFWKLFYKCPLEESHRSEREGNGCLCDHYKKRYYKLLKGKTFLPKVKVGSDVLNDALVEFREAWNRCVYCKMCDATKHVLPF